MNILVNLPAGFFSHPELTPVFQRLRSLGDLRTTSHNTAEEIQQDLAWADAVLTWSWPSLTRELLEGASALKFAGHIDLSQASARVALERGLPVSLSRHGFSPAVAEMALGLILNTLRKISDYHSQMRQGTERWVRQFPTEVDPLERELTGKSVGLIGFGRVGRRLAALLEPFQPRLRIVDPYISQQIAAAHHASLVDLQEMIRESDVVVMCAASNSGTRHLVGPEEIALFRQHAVFVNVGRAALVDTAALVERLQRGGMFAALDVFDREPLEQDAVLRSLPNVYLTPHRAGGTIAAARRILDYLVDDLEAVISGQPRKHPLVEEMLPSLDG